MRYRVAIIFSIFLIGASLFAPAVRAQSSYADSDVPLILPRAIWENAPSVDGLLDWMPEDKGAQTFQDDNPNSNGAIPDYAPVERVVIHDTGCSLASARCNSDTVDPISVIQSIYRDHAKNRGWGDMGYHYIVDRKGNIYEGRFGGNGTRGAHVYDSKNCRNFNVGTVGVVVLGNYTNSQPPQAATTALAKLVGWLSAANGLDPADTQKTAPVWANPKNGGGKCDTNYGGFTQNYTGPVLVGHNDVELNNSDPGILDIAKLRAQAKNWKEKYADYLYQAKNDKMVVKIDGGVIKKIADEIAVLNAENQVKVQKINDNQIALFPEANQTMLADGTLVKSRTRNEIYVLEAGKRRHISSARLFKKLGYSLANVKVLSDRELLGYAKGDAIVYSDGSLLASEKDGKVYLIKNSEKRYIISSAVFRNNKFKEKDIIKVPEIDLEAYPSGGIVGNLSEGATVSLSHKASAPNYLIMDGGKKLIPSWEMFDRWKFVRAKIRVISKKDFDLYPDKGELLLPDSTLIYEDGKPERYLVYKEKRYWISNYEAFSALGLNKQKAMALSAKEMGKYSSGKAVASADDWRAVLAGKQTTAIVLASVMPIVKLTQTPQISQQPSADQSGDQSIKIGLFSVAASESVSVTADGPFTVKMGKTGEQKTYASGETAMVNWQNAGDTEFTAQNNGTIFTISSYHFYNWSKTIDFNTFRGNLSLVYSQKLKKIWMVNALPFEEYLQGLGEALNTDSPEYRKAFSIASRSYALFHLQNGGKYGKDEVYHLNNTSSDQVYRGYAWEAYAPNLVLTTRETAGEVLKYNGKVARAVYSSDSGGTTKNACALWGREFCGADYGYLAGGVKDPEGTVRRDAASLKASHGVGMSATGARRLAELGKTYKEILAYYYKDVAVEKVY